MPSLNHSGPAPLPHRGPPALAELAALMTVRPRERRVEKDQEILAQGAAPQGVHVLLDGYAAHSQVLHNGRRQITAILVPGDLCDLDAAMRGRAGYSVSALTDCRLARLSATSVADRAALNPALALALLPHLHRQQAIMRQWLVNLGRRSADERLAFLFCELGTRLAAVGLVQADRYALPITQADLADALGMTSVHLNRALQRMRREGLITLADGVLVLRDRPVLERLALFDPAYLRT